MHLNVRSVCAAAGLWLSVASRVLAQEPVTITGKVTSDAGQALGQVEVAIPTMGLFNGRLPVDPKNSASPKVKMPPSDATIQ